MKEYIDYYKKHREFSWKVVHAFQSIVSAYYYGYKNIDHDNSKPRGNYRLNISQYEDSENKTLKKLVDALFDKGIMFGEIKFEMETLVIEDASLSGNIISLIEPVYLIEGEKPLNQKPINDLIDYLMR
jgi:hypothetical protein